MHTGIMVVSMLGMEKNSRYSVKKSITSKVSLGPMGVLGKGPTMSEAIFPMVDPKW